MVKEEKVKKKRYLPLLIILGGVGILALMAKGTSSNTTSSSKYNISLKTLKKNNPTYFSGLGFCIQNAKLNGSIIGVVPNGVGSTLKINGTFNGVLINSTTYNAGDIVNKPLFPQDVLFSNNNDHLSVQFLQDDVEVLYVEYEGGCNTIMQAGSFLI